MSTGGGIDLRGTVRVNISFNLSLYVTYRGLGFVIILVLIYIINQEHRDQNYFQYCYVC